MTCGVAVFLIVTSVCGAAPTVVVADAWLLLGLESSGVPTVAVLVTLGFAASSAFAVIVIGEAAACAASEPDRVQVSDCVPLQVQPAPGLTERNWTAAGSGSVTVTVWSVAKSPALLAVTT